MSDWWKKAVVYQIYPQSFQDSNGDGIGDLKGIMSRLDYLQSLGVNTLWLTPIYESPMVDNGYDVADYKAINPIYGTMDDFDQLLKDVHDRHMHLLMDMVVNHTSDQCKWFQESKKSRTGKYADYYIWEDPKPDGSAPTNMGGVFGGSAWEYVPERKQYYLHMFAKQQVDLNWDNPEVRKAVYDCMIFWAKKGVDGFRLDSLNSLSKRRPFVDLPKAAGSDYGNVFACVSNGPHLHEYLREMNKEVFSKYDMLTVGETSNTTVEEATKYIRPDELSMVFQFEHMDVDSGRFGQYSNVRFKMSDLRDTLAKWQKGMAWNALYLGNHDQPRLVSRFGDDKHFRKESAKMLATMYILQKGTPYIFEGDEIGMTNVNFKSIDDYHDLDSHQIYNHMLDWGVSKEEALDIIQRKSRDNGRTPFQWDDSKEAGFTTGKPWMTVNANYKQINAAEAEKDPDSILAYYKKLLKLRNNTATLIEGDFKLLSADDSSIFAYQRSDDKATYLVITSFAKEKVRYDLATIDKQFDQLELALNNYDDLEESDNVLYLKPYQALVLKVKD
ncbi:glycoside hydrolase family 13 protein [Limosilactobacillus difficilis]|uniref:glycoside hydrolase family 13 protein n=1 Tax=Limosilactobacillus difficilis TaxID=2991838 RepID=UPI0024B98239|nr:alpha-glucosidase [Limosilactobacillus difficilis]